MHGFTMRNELSSITSSMVPYRAYGGAERYSYTCLAYALNASVSSVIISNNFTPTNKIELVVYLSTLFTINKHVNNV